MYIIKYNIYTKFIKIKKIKKIFSKKKVRGGGLYRAPPYENFLPEFFKKKKIDFYIFIYYHQQNVNY